jgi:hypothetical protein
MSVKLFPAKVLTGSSGFIYWSESSWSIGVFPAIALTASSGFIYWNLKIYILELLSLQSGFQEFIY